MKAKYIIIPALLTGAVILGGWFYITRETTETFSEHSSAESEIQRSFEGSSEPESSVEESSEISVQSSEEENSVPPKPRKATAEDLEVIQNYETKYFVKKLTDEQKYYFAELYSAAVNFEESAVFYSPIPEDDLTTLMYLLNYDCPELIHINGDYFPVYTGEELKYVSSVKLNYVMDKKKYQSAMSELKRFFDDLKKTLNGKTDLEKEKYVYDYIFDNCIYNETNELSGSVYSTLISHFGRCESYSKAFMWCMRELGIETISVSGPQNWDPESAFADHSWNIIKLNGKYYHLDITVDNVQGDTDSYNPPNYGFFNVNDDAIAGGRTINEVYTSLGVPNCESMELNYHVLNGCYIKSGKASKDKIFELLGQSFNDEGINALSIKFENKEEYENVLQNLESWVSEFITNNSDEPYTYINYYNNLSQCIVIDAKHTTTEGQ